MDALKKKRIFFLGVGLFIFFLKSIELHALTAYDFTHFNEASPDVQVNDCMQQCLKGIDPNSYGPQKVGAIQTCVEACEKTAAEPQ